MIATQPLLEVMDLTVEYATDAGPVRAVDRVSLDVAPGEFIGIVGESGCGKSTLLFAIARLLSPSCQVVGGSVHLHGRDLLAMDEETLRDIRWRDYSVVMQSAMNALNPVLTVGAQLGDTIAAHASIPAREARDRSASLLRLVGIDPQHLKSFPHQLSGGMRQRAMIAMALVFTPELVIMDEPTSALDVVAQRSLMLQIKELQRKIGFAVVFVTHDMSLVSHFSDRLAVMYAGQIVEVGRTRDVFDDPKHPYTRALMQSFPSIVGPKEVLQGIPGTPPDLLRPPTGCRFHPAARSSSRASGRTSRPWSRLEPRLFGVTFMAVTSKLDPARAVEQPALATPILQAIGLTRHFRVGSPFSRRFLHAADDVDLAIGARQIVALVGESGSGKTTIARLLALIYRPTRGEIRYKGRPLSSLRKRREVLQYRGRVPMVFQDPYSSLNPVYRVSHGIMRALRLHRPEVRPGDRRAEAERVLESVGLTPPGRFLAKYPHELSGGQRQRIGFAQALASSPELILADEPVSMLDVSVRIGVLNLMAQLRREQGISLLYITHDIASARYVADWLMVMYAGYVVESGPSEDVLAHPKHPYTQLLLSAVPDPRAPVALPSGSDVAEPPRVVDPGEGCRFRWRCPYAVEECTRVTPRLRPMRPDHSAACHVAQPDALT